MTNQIQQPLNISKQILIFMVVVLGMTILLGIVSVLLKTSMIGVSIIVPMVAAMISGQSFVKALVFYFGIAFVLIRWGYGGMTQKFANKQN